LLLRSPGRRLLLPRRKTYRSLLKRRNEMAKKWIQKTTASIKRRGTEGVCTGSKFGGPTCRPGTRRYALAKTFKAIGKARKSK